jgi:hypothetical protein
MAIVVVEYTFAAYSHIALFTKILYDSTTINLIHYSILYLSKWILQFYFLLRLLMDRLVDEFSELVSWFAFSSFTALLSFAMIMKDYDVFDFSSVFVMPPLNSVVSCVSLVVVKDVTCLGYAICN